jgi:hypothetical protein
MTVVGSSIPRTFAGTVRQILPTGLTAGSPQQALDCACDLYLGH